MRSIWNIVLNINQAYDAVPEPWRFIYAMVGGTILVILIRIVPTVGFALTGILLGCRLGYLKK